MCTLLKVKRKFPMARTTLCVWSREETNVEEAIFLSEARLRAFSTLPSHGMCHAGAQKGEIMNSYSYAKKGVWVLGFSLHSLTKGIQLCNRRHKFKQERWVLLMRKPLVNIEKVARLKRPGSIVIVFQIPRTICMSRDSSLSNLTPKEGQFIAQNV